MTRFVIVCLLMISLLLVQASATPPCPTGIENLSTDGSSVFGLRWDGVRLNMGQSITLICDSRMLTVACRIIAAETGENNGVPYVNPGDELHVDVMNSDNVIVGTASGTIIHTTGFDWVTVDFSAQDLRLPIGDYLLAVYLTVDKISSINYSPTDVIDGQRFLYDFTSWGTPMSSDLSIQATWEDVTVASEKADWGQVKSLYR